MIEFYFFNTNTAHNKVDVKALANQSERQKQHGGRKKNVLWTDQSRSLPPPQRSQTTGDEELKSTLHLGKRTRRNGEGERGFNE